MRMTIKKAADRNDNLLTFYTNNKGKKKIKEALKEVNKKLKQANKKSAKAIKAIPLSTFIRAFCNSEYLEMFAGSQTK